MPLIQVDNLTFKYSHNPVLSDVSFSIEAGSFLAITGPNGSGKSTLLNLISGKLKPSSGKITIEGNKANSYSVKSLAEKIAYVRQEFVPAFGFTVKETVLMARTMNYGKLGFESQQDRDIANKAMQDTDTYQFANRRLDQLSGGERQRVFIARALAQNTPILLLDEPTSFLDYKHQIGIYNLLKKMQTDNNKTIITISHDINMASQYCDCALLLTAANQYQFGKFQEVFTEENLKNTFDIDVFSARINDIQFFIPAAKPAFEPENTGQNHP